MAKTLITDPILDTPLPPQKKKKIISFFLSFTSTSHKFFLVIILYNLKENQWTKLDFVSF